MEELPRQGYYLSLGAARIQEIKSIVSKLEVNGSVYTKFGGANVKPSHRPRRKYRRRPFNLLMEYNRRQKDFVWLETHIWHAKRFQMKRQWGYALPDTPTFKGYRATLRAAAKSCLLQDVSYLCCLELEGPSTLIIAGLSRVSHPSSLAALNTPQAQLGQKWISLTLFKPERQPKGALGDVDILWHPPFSGASRTQTDNSRMWMWVHPSSYNHVIEALTQVFQLVKSASKSEVVSSQEIIMDVGETKKENCDVSCGEEMMQGVSETKESMEFAKKENTHSDLIKTDEVKSKKKKKSKNAKKVNELKLEKRNVPFQRTPKYTSSDNCITMTLLKDTLNRFHLTGPRSYDVLMAALIPAKVTYATEENEIISCDKSEEFLQPWWKQYYHDKERELCHQQQVDSWKKLASCPQLPQVVLPLTVRDPRVTLPCKKSPIAANTSDLTQTVDHPDWPVDSPLYDSGLRDLVTYSKEPDDVINKRRSQLLVPGSKLPESPDEAKLPVLLLSRPPTCAAGRGSGWDVIMAAGWGMSVWMSLIFCGGVAGGQQEAENLHMEILTPLPPYLLPDTPAGDYYTTWLAKERCTQFFKRPPANRLNFIKLGVQYPFHSPWRKLLQDWEPGTQDIFVLRDSRLVSGLAQLIGNNSKTVRRVAQRRKASVVSEDTPSKRLKIIISEENTQDSNSYSEKDEAYKKVSIEDNPLMETLIESPQQHQLVFKSSSVEEELQTLNHGCLVMVQLILQFKGTLESGAMICLPQEEDIEARQKIMKPTDKKEGILEPPHKDTQFDKRVKLKEEHAKIKGRIRRVRRKARLNVAREKDIVSAAQSEQTLKKAITDAVEKVNEENKVILAKFSSFKEEMEDAWLMKTDGPLQCCSRKIMGYVISGNFCQTLGRGAGIGWVALKPLLHLLHLYKDVSEKTVESKSESHEHVEDRRESKWIYSVLVRNPSSLQYHWARLCVVVQP
ncbi:Ribonucleases P/MRP protein subunit POP1-like [Homarus americanus]|uniref:Ribonucleases P/MRP protein subunit POP1-like n=1 Tax=Homarus americanus TaxID=6706 RepID=A0A8J5K8N9_HOMAM|nr:Ribonucleases P/MRP protein subunit POP1-like [Homarus americanus]